MVNPILIMSKTNFETIKILDVGEALSKAKELSKELPCVLYVIKSRENIDNEIVDVFYIDDESLIRNWETLIGIYENGKQIKS